MPRPALTATPSLAGDADELWLAVPDADRLRLADIGPLERRADSFGRSDVSLSVFRGTRPKVELGIGAQLDDALDALATPIAVATAALVLTARQIAQHRRPELALLAARGAGTPRLASAALTQWAAVAVPAGLAAPFLAGPLLRLLDRAGLIPGGAPGTGTLAVGWAAALLAVVVHGAALLLPTVRTVRDRHAVRRLRLRLGRFAGAQRLGADLALAAVAVLGWLQLRQYRSPVTGGGVDPVLVLADEPTGELDTASGEDVFAALRHANEELGATVLVVTHDPLVSGQVRRTVRIRDGRTSTETLRGPGTAAEEYTVLDRAGRLQLPRDHMERYGLRGRVRLTAEPDHIGVWPGGSDRRDGADDAGSERP